MIRLLLNNNGQTLEATFDNLEELSHDVITSLIELINKVGAIHAQKAPVDEPTEAPAPVDEPASESQKKFMRDLRIPFADNITKAEAKALLSKRLDK